MNTRFSMYLDIYRYRNIKACVYVYLFPSSAHEKEVETVNTHQNEYI